MKQNDHVFNIQVVSVITNSEGEKSEMTLFTEATYKQNDGKYFLLYDETELSGMAGTKTLLTYDGIDVHIKRFGENKSDLKIALGIENESLYRTPYGVFLMKTKGKTILWEDLHIELLYSLEFEGEKPSEVSIIIDSTRD